MSDLDDVQRLIRLKRFETPGEEYYESFVDRFKERQRSEMLRSTARGLLFERIAMWFEESGGARRFVPAGAVAAAAVGAGVYLVAAVSPQRGGDTYAGAAVAEAHAVADLSAAKDGPTVDDVIRLKLPQPKVRVPEAKASIGEAGKVIPAGLFREL